MHGIVEKNKEKEREKKNILFSGISSKLMSSIESRLLDLWIIEQKLIGSHMDLCSITEMIIWSEVETFYSKW